MKTKFIEYCKIINIKCINNSQHIAKYILDNIYDNYFIGTEDFSISTFEAVTQENILNIIEEGMPGVFDDKVTYIEDYIDIEKFRSGLRFLIDYAENHEETNKDAKKYLKNILNNHILYLYKEYE